MCSLSGRGFLSFASTTDNAAGDPVDAKRQKTGPSAKAQSRGLAADADGSSSDGAGVCVSYFFFSRPIFSITVLSWWAGRTGAMATTGPQVVDLEAVESAMSSMDSVLSLCGGKSAKAQVSLPPKALLFFLRTDVQVVLRAQQALLLLIVQGQRELIRVQREQAQKMDELISAMRGREAVAEPASKVKAEHSPERRDEVWPFLPSACLFLFKICLHKHG